jgi:glycosyltransferase involved in cell wall biosynthesis
MRRPELPEGSSVDCHAFPSALVGYRSVPDAAHDDRWLPEGDKQFPVHVKVIHIITDLDVGGAEVTLASLVERLGGTQVQNAVITLGSAGQVAGRIQRAGVPVFSLGVRSAAHAAQALWRLVRLIRQFQPDVLQTWLYHADFLGTVAGTIAGVPNIVWNIRCAELDPLDHSRSLPALLKVLAFMSRCPSTIICNSAAGRRAHEALGYRPRRWCIIPNGFDTGAFQPCVATRVQLRRELAVRCTDRLVGLLARFHPMKDHTTFLNAAKIVTAARPDVHFVAAGRGVETAPSLQNLISEMGLRDRIHLLPEQNDAPRFFAALDVAVSSSYGEAFPNVVGEAMACGTPCVVTDVGDSAYIVGDAGVMVPPRDPAALAAGILRILDLDRATHAALGCAARERILSTFSLERAAARYEQLYLELAGGQQKTPDRSVCAG